MRRNTNQQIDVLVAVAVIVLCTGLTANAQYTLTTLVSFNGANGANPQAGLIADANGNLFGTTAFGSNDGDGTVFEVAAGTHVLSTLASFNGANGANPRGAGLITDASGNLYGTTYSGGANGYGTVFEVAAGTHVLSTLASFNGANGQFPVAGLHADPSGNLYGTTTTGGANSYGTVFELAAGTHVLSILAAFNLTNGASPYGSLLADASGNLYGTTLGGGVGGGGTVFKLAAGTHAMTTLATFNGTNGGSPQCGLIADAGGNLYGTTIQGGANGDGTVFEVAAGTHALTTLVTFNGANGVSPNFAGLIADANGNLYGTTERGGANDYGTVFELSPVPEPASLALARCGLVIAALAVLQQRICATMLQ